MTIETRHFALDVLEVRASEETQTKRAVGYAAIFNANSHDLGGFMERIAPEAFVRTLGEAGRGERNIYALWSHDSSQPLGSTRSGKLVLTVDERGLAFELDVTRFNHAQLDALEDNDLQMSFGFRVRDQEWEEQDDGSIIRTLKDVDLIEVSPVINPAYPQTEAALRSLDVWKNEQRAAEKIDTLDQLKRVMFLQASLRAAN